MTPRSTAVLADNLTDRPITHDFTAPVTVVARAGYEAFTEQRTQVRPWADLRAAERFRWQLAADLVWDSLEGGEFLTVVELRARYHVLTDVPDWSQLEQSYRNRWQAVLVAMLQSARTLQAEKPTPTASPLLPYPTVKREPKPKQPRKPRTPKAVAPDPRPLPPTAVASLRERLAEKRAQERKGW